MLCKEDGISLLVSRVGYGLNECGGGGDYALCHRVQTDSGVRPAQWIQQDLSPGVKGVRR